MVTPTKNSSYPPLALHLDGQWSEGTAGVAADVLNPADASVLGRVPLASDRDLDRAVHAAVRGLECWRVSTPADRAAVLGKAAELIRVRRSVNALVMTLEQGKPLRESEAEWDRVSENLDWHAQALERLGEVGYPVRAGGIAQRSVPQPVGVCLALTAWNFPAVLPIRKLAPALAAGCSVILKAAEETPASAMAVVRALVDAGLPDGVVNLVFGVPARVSQYLIARPEVRKVSFTGSVPVGKELARLAAAGLKRATLELGGHAPMIVCEDADVEEAASLGAAFKYRNAGQVCIAPSRFYVHTSVLPRFVEAFAGYAEGLEVGDGRRETTTMGPMANPRRIEAMTRFMADAEQLGARTVLGGRGLDRTGFYWLPTVLCEVPEGAAIMREEPFGPIAPIVAFTTLDEVVARANALPFGLAAYAFTASEEISERLIRDVEAGSLAINTVIPAQADTPFGGVKESGYGYEGGLEGIEGFLSKKLVSTKI